MFFSHLKINLFMEENVNKNIKSIVQVLASNITTIVSGVLVAFILPKIIPVESYGLYKTFTLYASYLGLFSFGIIDGIVLQYGEKDYEDIDKLRFRSYFKWYFSIHAIIAIIIIIIALTVPNKEYMFILISLAIYMISSNITGYFQQISQITMRFKELSIRKILQSIFNVVIILLMFMAYKANVELTYHSYLVLWICVNVGLTIWYVITYKDIVFSDSLPMKETLCDIRKLIIVGFPLLFANLCSSLILTLDRQFVNLLFTTSEYAIYAFAYNMLSLVTVATSAISTVLYPVLKRTNDENLTENYDTLISILLCFVFAAMVVYFPLSLFIKGFLPKYVDSIAIFRIIFPGLAISSTITVIMHNYYKVFGDNLLFFRKSIVVLIISAIANYVAYILFKATKSISYASILTMIFWYVYVEQYFVERCGYKRNRNLGFILIMSLSFYIVSYAFNEIIGGILYCVFLCVGIALLYKDRIGDIKSIVAKK